MHELYKRYRPKKFTEIFGQEAAVKQLQKWSKAKAFPHAMLFCGPSGTGKTTIARILRKKLNCGPTDYKEINCADFRGIEMARDVRNAMMLKASGGESRLWLIDEAHQLSKDAQNAFLKMLEDTPKHAYIILGTSEPQKLLDTIRTRCSTLKLNSLTTDKLEELMTSVLKKEKAEISEKVIAKIAEVSLGSARQALVILDAVMQLDNENEMMAAVEDADAQKDAIEICRALFRKCKWNEMAKILKSVKEDAEKLRHLVLAYCTSILLSGNNKLAPRCFVVIDCFRDNFYDSKQAGLVAACWEALETK